MKIIYNSRMQSQSQPLEYRALLLSRRGEWIAWGTVLLVAAAWLFLALSGKPIFLAMPILEIFLVFAAASISLGNWMDRHTSLRLDDQGVSFRNGLRNIHQSWRQIKQVRVFPTRWGKKVEVIGDQVHFQFRTLGEVKIQGELKGRMGIENGDEALRSIIAKSGLQQIEQRGEGYYYARK